MSLNPHDYSAYMGHNKPDELAEVTKLAEAQQAARRRVEVCEEGLKLAQEELRLIAEKQLPELMDNLGLANYETKSGLAVNVSEKIRVSLPAENKAKGHDWIEENGFGGTIKTMVIAAFTRGKLEEANELAANLQNSGFAASVERKIEPSTLSALIKEQLAQGKDIPLDTFGVFRQRVAKVEVNTK